jgi:hypothetical protein
MIITPSPEMAREYAKWLAYDRWKIKNPPPWLLCWIMRVSYRVAL